jgi:hypothetical protein
MNGDFSLRLSEEVRRLVDVRARAPLTIDHHVHFCDIAHGLVWTADLLKDVLKTIAHAMDSSGLVPAIVFQSARERLGGTMPSSVDDLVYRLAETEDDPPSLYLFNACDSMLDGASRLEELTKQLGRCDPRWIAASALVDARGWDPECPEHGNVFVTMKTPLEAKSAKQF